MSEVDRQVYAYGRGIRKCRSALRMDDVLKAGLKNQTRLDCTAVGQLDGALEVPLLDREAGRGVRPFRRSEKGGIRGVSNPHCRKISRPVWHGAVGHDSCVEEIRRRIETLAGDRQ